MANNASVKVFESRNTTYGLGETLKFNFDPTSIQMINPAETYLRMFVVVGEQGQESGFNAGSEADINHMFPYTFNSKVAGASLIKNITVRSNGTVLEQITDYNRLARVICNYTENSSMENKKRLYEGADSRKVREVNTLQQRGRNAGSSTTGTQSNRKVEILIPIALSGILGGSQRQPFPNMVCPLEVEILLENDAFNVLEVQGDKLGSEMSGPTGLNTKDNQQYIMGYSTSRPYKVFTMASPAGNAVTTLAIENSDGAGFVNPAIASNEECVNYPFFNGCKVRVSGLQTNANPPVAIEDKIINVSSVALNNGRLTLTIPSTDFSTGGGNANATPLVNVEYAQTAKVAPAVSAMGKPTLVISDVEFVVGVLRPNPQQFANVEKLVSGGGYSYGYQSYQDFPTNINNGVTRSSNYINCNYQRCKGLLSFWEDLGNAEIDRDNLAPLLNSQLAPLSYQYNLANILVPNREVSLSRYNRTRLQTGQWNAIHIKELENCLNVCGYDVKDLSDIDGALICASRALVPSGNYTYNMKTQGGETRLNLNFSTNSRPNGLLLHNFVCHLRQLVIKGNDKMVIV